MNESKTSNPRETEVRTPVKIKGITLRNRKYISIVYDNSLDHYLKKGDVGRFSELEYYIHTYRNPDFQDFDHKSEKIHIIKYPTTIYGNEEYFYVFHTYEIFNFISVKFLIS